MTKPKLLWCGDFAALTGFGRVSGALLPLLQEKYDIAVLACNWHGDICEEQKSFRMYPAANRHQTEPFGVQRIREIVEREKPDIVCSLNDPWIVSEQYRQIQDLHKQGRFKFCGYLTMDSYNWTAGIDMHMNEWDAVISFTEFGAYEFLKAGLRRPITVIPHGLDTEVFKPMDQKEARKKLGLPEDLFIVLNANRNQFRKRIDITISAFAKFAVGKPDAKLYLHMGLKDQGWDLLPLFNREMRKNGLDPANRIILTGNHQGPPNVPVHMLQYIYSCADIGINTAKGCGWELTSFEHAGCRVAQVVPNHTSTKEIFEGYGKLIDCNHVDVDTNFNREMPCPSDEHLAEILNGLYQDREELLATADACYERVTQPCFRWDAIAAEFHEVFQEVLEGGEKLSEEQPGGPVNLEGGRKKRKRSSRK